MNAIKEMDKRFKESDSKIASLTERVDAVNKKIEELCDERTSLAEELVKEYAIKDQLEKFSVELHKFDGNVEMMNYLFIGFMMSNGIEPSPEPEEKPKKKRRKRTQEEKTAFEEWKQSIHYACIGYSEKDVLHKAYERMRAVYGFCFEQEYKDYYKEFEKKPRNNLELIYHIENTRETYKNLLIGNIEEIIKEMEKENK